MADIRRLDDATVERIAAGEVVERPASVVKELVENSLDADAARVEVSVDAGGTDGIRITDDGIGMTEDEVRRAVDQHTTSKIRDIDDLEGGVGTLGFRGEALHAIGAVSRMTVTTRPRSDRDDVATPRGTELVVEGGDVTGVEPAGCPEGTTIEVEDLFYNVPARRKYLKTDATEFAHVNTVVTSYALANPDIAVSLTHDGRETFATTGQGDRREAVMAVYGRDVAQSMVDVDASVDGDGDSVSDLPEGPLDGVSGLVSHPETTRASREYLSTYVNGRYVTANVVRDAVVEAYDTQLAPDRYPFAVLFLDVPAGDVDVNVHPRKLDVRFAAEDAVSEQIETAVSDALLDAGLLRSGAPRGKSAPEQTDIAPERTEADDGAESPTTTGESATTADESATTADERESRVDTGRRGADRSKTASRSPASTSESSSGSEDTRPTGDQRTTETHPPDGATSREPGVSPGSSADGADADAPDSAGQNGSIPPSETASATASEPDQERGENAVDGQSADRKFRGSHDQTRLGTDEESPATDVEAFDALPSMRVLGQFRETYVVAETEDGLVLIDQHAADERINYERLRERFAGDVTTQALADPVELPMTAREAELFESFDDALATLGFRAERTGDRTLEVRTVPSLVAEAADPGLLRDVLGAFVDGQGAAAETVEAAADELLADLACYPSITGNTSLTDGSIRDLLATLDDCENPWACPHGRPVIIEFDDDELEARFERDYPGHAGRRD